MAGLEALHARGLISDDALENLGNKIDTANADTPAEGVQLSPAMRQMMRRSIGRRLLSQTPEERMDTAEHAVRGAAGVGALVNPVLGGATAGLTSQFMGDTPRETAAAVGRNVVPYGAARLAQFAPRTVAAIGATMLPSATQSGAGDAQLSEQDKFEGGYKERKAGFLKSIGLSRGDTPNKGQRALIDQFEAREQPNRDAAIKLDSDRRNADLAAQQEKDARTAWHTRMQPDINRLKDTTKANIAGAPDLATAQKIFFTAMKEKEELGKTFAEKHSDWMEGLQLGSAIGGGILGYRVPAGRASRIQRADTAADKAFLQTYGPGAKGGAKQAAANRQALDLRANQLGEATKLKPYSPIEPVLGASLPAAGGVVIPNAIDAATTTDPEVRRRAIANMNPLDPASWENYVRAAGEGGAASAVGMAVGAGRRDFHGIKSRGVGTLKTIREANAKADEAAGRAAAEAQTRSLARSNARKAEAEAQSKRLDNMMAANPVKPPRVRKGVAPPAE